MRIADRHDGLLLAGLALAGVIVFERTIHDLLQIARQGEGRDGVALLPALVILAAIFIFHQNLKRQEMHARAAAAAAEAAQSRARDLERLVTFGDALARALTLDALREVVWRHLPRLIGDCEAWVFVRDRDGWEELAGAICTTRDDVREALSQPDALGGGGPSPLAGSLAFPLRVGNQVVGALGVLDGDRCDPATRQLIAASVALLAIAVRNVQLFAETQDLATRDRLTGCYNRPQALELLDGELRRAARAQAPLTVVMLDIDHFKQINDRYGHLAGDAVLTAVGQRLGETLRRSDHRCRSGADEFLLILPETPPHAAVLVAEAIRREVQALAVPVNGRTVHLSASVGVAHAGPAEVDVAALVNRANAALCCAKQDGRNCVRVDLGTCDAAEAAVFEALPVAGTLPS